MIKSQYLLGILVLLILGCKSTQNISRNEAPTFVMEKTICFGLCPSWIFHLYPDGSVTYHGRENVDRIGKYSAKISDEKLIGFIDMLEDASFFDYNESYYKKVTDLPTTYLYYNNGEKSLKIMDYYGAPSSLKELESEIELFIESIPWKKDY